MSINRGARAREGFAKITVILSDCARSIIRGVRSGVGCTKITDICQSAVRL
jgi:hypothetical protein